MLLITIVNGKKYKQIFGLGPSRETQLDWAKFELRPFGL
jgi:hypothetical protein